MVAQPAPAPAQPATTTPEPVGTREQPTRAIASSTPVRRVFPSISWPRRYSSLVLTTDLAAILVATATAFMLSLPSADPARPGANVVVGIVAVHWRPKAQWWCFIALLLGYGALLQFGGGTLEKVGSLEQRIDTAVLGRFAYEWDATTGIAFDPEGLLSTLGALATTLFGLLCGGLLRREQARAVLLTGVAAALVGWWWAGWLPWNKQLWTPSFVLWTGGLAAVALAAAHGWVDRLGHRPWGRAFGRNAIGAYAGAWLCTVVLAATGWMAPLYGTVFGPVGATLGPYAQSLAFALAFVAAWAVVVWALDKRGWYWKV